MAVQAPSVVAPPEYTDGWARVVEVIRWLLVAVLVADVVAGVLPQPGESRLRSEISRVAGPRGVPVYSGGHDLLLRFPQIGSGIFLLLLVVLLLGGQPRRATRWATFWLLLTPMNLGMLRTLVREAPWSGAMRAWPEPPPHRMMPIDARMTDGSAFVMMLLSYIPVQLALAGLASLR